MGKRSRDSGRWGLCSERDTGNPRHLPESEHMGKSPIIRPTVSSRYLLGLKNR